MFTLEGYINSMQINWYLYIIPNKYVFYNFYWIYWIYCTLTIFIQYDYFSVNQLEHVVYIYIYICLQLYLFIDITTYIYVIFHHAAMYLKVRILVANMTVSLISVILVIIFCMDQKKTSTFTDSLYWGWIR